MKLLSSHTNFTLKNPNQCRDLVLSCTMNAATSNFEEDKLHKFLGLTN